MTNPADLPPEVVAHIADLEAKLAHARRGLALFQADAARLSITVEDLSPMTPEEEDELMSAPQGKSLREIVAEFELMGAP